MTELFSNSSVLGAMITPAVLITACASLILSTANRLGRIFDRVNLLKNEIESFYKGNQNFIQERRVIIRKQLIVQKKRAKYIQISMKYLYSAICFFVAASLASAIDILTGNKWEEVPIGLAIFGVGLLLIGTLLLFYESRYNLVFIEGQIEITEFLESNLPKE